ncbi:MAG TPA: hypothetical protein VMO17_16630 [Terriglobia bacterium]|nr:hypothetical protein [Terriglobia bacterium]
MKTLNLVLLLVATILLPWNAAAKEKQAETHSIDPIGWLDLQAGGRDFEVSLPDLRKTTGHLARGALVPIYKTRQKHGATQGQVGKLNLETGSAELGWVELHEGEMQAPSSYPFDAELLRLLGPPYLDDFVAEHTDIARFLVRQAQGPPALLCYVYAAPLLLARLAIYTPAQGKYQLGATLNIPLTEMKAGITSLEIKDLVGDGGACAISKEPFQEQAQTYGTILRIRRIDGGQFQELWQAPIEFHNLSRYNSKLQILQPPERNMGAPGTVTTGEVTFRSQGKGQEPVWKGKVEFFVFGRDAALDSVNIEKACPWDGRQFAPLR